MIPTIHPKQIPMKKYAVFVWRIYYKSHIRVNILLVFFLIVTIASVLHVSMTGEEIEKVPCSSTWFESNEEKQLFMSQEKAKMGQINCPYFQKGNTHCPFGNKCFYLHTRPGEIERDELSPRPLASGLSESTSTRQDVVPPRLQTLHVSAPQMATGRNVINSQWNQGTNEF
ncbi:hypothetical protein ABEB36_012306 [Hypothenemus hampei]|uniref:RING-type E3 ubiquitin transferase n=1 Tax=Hypothenemus hampei TaxID=57062 RepID=A0ABD1EF33_HYPHA